MRIRIGEAYIYIFIFITLLIIIPSITSAQARTITDAYVVEVKPPWDTIDQGISECIIDAISTAEREGKAVIIDLDTYGGWLDSAFTIGDALLMAKVPVITYVSGGKSLSAGTMIMLPAHIAAVSPHSIIGAMQPISYDPVSGTYVYVNQSKVINPIIEKVTTYARVRGRNETAAELFVRENLVLNPEEAVKANVVDLIASSMNDLLSEIDGWEVSTLGGTYVLRIRNLMTYQCSIRSRMISIFSNSLISSILLTIGIMATIFALVSGKLPVLPLALLFLVLGLVGSGFNPNIASIFMMVLGAILLMVELFVTPGFGILGVSGIILLVLGFAFIPAAIPAGLAAPQQYFETIRYFAIGLGVGMGTLTGFIAYKVLKAKKTKVTLFVIEGKVGKAIEEIKPGQVGFVIVDGEYWRAIAEDEIPKNAEVEVVGRKGAYLVVKKRASKRSG